VGSSRIGRRGQFWQNQALTDATSPADAGDPSATQVGGHLSPPADAGDPSEQLSHQPSIDAGPATHTGPPSRVALWAVIALLVLMVLMNNFGNVLFSFLAKHHPLATIVLNDSNRNLALASPLLSAWSYYLVGFLRFMAPDPLFYLLGVWYGDAAIRWMERKSPTYGGIVRQWEQWFQKARYPIVFVFPNNYVCLFAGAAGMSGPGFLATAASGTVVRLWLIRTFAHLFKNQLASIRNLVSAYRWPILAMSVVVVGFTLWSDHRRTGRDPIGDLVHLEDEIAESAEVEPPH
jgi:membrane protein DedA with SNARE-associated domain